MKITALIENCPDAAKSLACEHGLSLYIEANGRKILFDTGETGAFAQNADKLGIDLKSVEMVVLSHGHNDHSGGLLTFFEENKVAPVYMKQEAGQPFFFRTLFFSSIGMDPQICAEHPERIRFTSDFVEMGNGLFLIANVAQKFPQPSGNKRLFVQKEKQMLPDRFDHEQILVVQEADGIHIITGCSHNGIMNVVEAVKARFSKQKIKSLVGGFHLMNFSLIPFLPPNKDDMEAVSVYLAQAEIEKIFTCHCTGEPAFRRLRDRLGNRVGYVRTGDVLVV